VSAPRIILASGSPRRVELLARITPNFLVAQSAVEERASGSPEEQVVFLARAKARDVARKHKGLVIGADTIVVLDGEILGKPSSREEAWSMLGRLSGREHVVLTGLYLLSTEDKRDAEAFERTLVRFRTLGDGEIEAYLDSGEYADKAGAYAIQGRGALLVEGITGDFFNVMGLPLVRLYLLLKSFDASFVAGAWAD
jgi:septum formation protein